MNHRDDVKRVTPERSTHKFQLVKAIPAPFRGARERKPLLYCQAMSWPSTDFVKTQCWAIFVLIVLPCFIFAASPVYIRTIQQNMHNVRFTQGFHCQTGNSLSLSAWYTYYFLNTQTIYTDCTYVSSLHNLWLVLTLTQLQIGVHVLQDCTIQPGHC